MRLQTPFGDVHGDDGAGVVAQAVALFGQYDIDFNYTPPALEPVRPWAIDALQQWRGDQRAAMGLSSAQWQDLAYAGKAAHCREWIADQSQPFGMEREAAVRGLSNLQMAQLIIGQNDAWLDANDQIDAAYTAARDAIEAAESVAEIEAALVGLFTTTP